MTDIKTLWKSQEMEGTVTLDNVHELAARFQRRIRYRNTLEYCATAVAVVVLGTFIWALPGVMLKTGSALCIAGALFVAWQLHRRGPAQSPPDEATSGLLEFHRGALTRQRDALRAVWCWYLAPMVPGLAVMLAGSYFSAPPALRPAALELLLTLPVPAIVVMFAIIWFVNARGARHLQKAIDDLNRSNG